MPTKTGLSGTPAEAGVRGFTLRILSGCGMSQWNPCRSRGASCPRSRNHGRRRVSVEPLPKQGCEPSRRILCRSSLVSVEPLPKQGCEGAPKPNKYGALASQWNPCRSRGARRQSEAKYAAWLVSVEPLPKQGCEVGFASKIIQHYGSQWNPCRSRGASSLTEAPTSESRSVSVEPLPKQGCEGQPRKIPNSELKVSVEPLPKQGCE